MPTYTNIAAYKFALIPEVGPARGRLLQLCKGWHLRGTILLSPEGLNLFVAGERASIDLLVDELRSWPGFAELEVKYSLSDHQPFNKMLVRIKREIIAFGVEGIEPGRHTSPKLPPAKLKEWLDEGRPLVLLDTRNDYEVRLGTFKNARAVGVDHFRDFPEAVRRLPPEMKEQPIVMFCTGGIRCEKAGPFMEREGFRQVWQLEGGILKYFEQCGGAHYEGECFVFDQRVGVDPRLQETGTAQCFACLAPLTAEEQRDPRYVEGVSCPQCHRSPAQRMAEILERRHEHLGRLTQPLPGSQPYDGFKPVNVPAACDGRPLVEALCRVVKHIPAPQWEAECAAGRVVDEERRPATAGQTVRAGERYLHRFPNLTEPDVDARIRILHEDEALIVIHKPAPLPMHAGGRFCRNTLQYLLNQVYHPQKPRPAHRLDANTTGLVLLTRTRLFASRLQPQFAEGCVRKRYLVRIEGHPPADAFRCDAPISARSGDLGSREIDPESGLDAITEFEVLRRCPDGSSLLEARPLTGRTNQIRLHLAHLGFPVRGDQAYRAGGGLGETQTLALGDPPLCLHAWQATFKHPLTGADTTFTAPPPDWARL